MAAQRVVRLAALLVAGGRGTRFGTQAPKQFLDLGGRPLLEHAAKALHESPIVNALYVVAPAGSEARVQELLQNAGLERKLQAVVGGGATRQDSVWQGLEAVGVYTHVLVHDAARPFVNDELILATVGAAALHGAATAGLPVSDTLFRAETDPELAPAGFSATRRSVRTARATAPLGRDGVWTVQTPQVFELELLREAHRHARARGLDATDDGQLVLELGHRLELVPGRWWNIKVTRPEDLAIAELLLGLRDRLGAEDPA